MACLTCSNGALRDKLDPKRDRTLRDMAAQGLINCTLSPFRAGFRGFDNQCGAFKPIAAKAAEARVQWRDTRMTGGA